MNNGGGAHFEPKMKELRLCSRESLLRLAKYLHLRRGLDQMSNEQLAKLIKWRTSRHRRERG